MVVPSYIFYVCGDCSDGPDFCNLCFLLISYQSARSCQFCLSFKALYFNLFYLLCGFYFTDFYSYFLFLLVLCLFFPFFSRVLNLGSK